MYGQENIKKLYTIAQCFYCILNIYLVNTAKKWKPKEIRNLQVIFLEITYFLQIVVVYLIMN